ncbi:MAG: hypothetical protein COB01_11895 [Lutibacter sp.]|nr:MAG: hypothetical protein COB01_11895 [Lutibacter sp.]
MFIGLILAGLICMYFALSINSYRQNQIETKKELRIVQGIAKDISLYKFYHKYGTERMGQVISSAEHLLNAIRNPERQMNKEEIDLHLHKLTWLWLSATPTTEYVALSNSGEINLISSDALRNKFREFNMEQEKLLQFEAIQVRYVDLQLRPFLNSHIDRTTIDTYQKADSLITNHFSSPFKNTSSDLLNNREFANILTDLIFSTKRIMLPYRRMAIVIKEIEEIFTVKYPSIPIVEYNPF